MLDNMLKEISNYLIDNGAIIIFPKDEDENIKIKKAIKNLELSICYSDLSTKDKNVLLLRYFPYIERYGYYLKSNLDILLESKRKKDYKSALEAGLNMLKIGNPNTSAYMNLAIFYLKLEDFNNAFRYLEIVYYLDKYNNEDTTQIKQKIINIKRIIETYNNPKLIKLYDSLISNINDYLYDNNSLDIHIKKEEFDLFKSCMENYQNLKFTANRNDNTFDIEIKNTQRKRS